MKQASPEAQAAAGPQETAFLKALLSHVPFPILPKPHQDVVLPTPVPPSSLPEPHPHQVLTSVYCQTSASAYLALDTMHTTVCDPLHPPAADHVLQFLPPAECDQVCATAAISDQVCATAAACDPMHPRAAMCNSVCDNLRATAAVHNCGCAAAA